MQEKKKDIKRELIEKGKKKGVLTFKEISDAFEDFMTFLKKNLSNLLKIWIRNLKKSK